MLLVALTGTGSGVGAAGAMLGGSLDATLLQRGGSATYGHRTTVMAFTMWGLLIGGALGLLFALYLLALPLWMAQEITADPSVSDLLPSANDTAP